MFTHNEIWIAIDRLAENHGYSTSGLARRAGLDPTALNRSKRNSPEGKPRWPSTESISKILTVTETPMDDFMLLITHHVQQQHSQPQAIGTAIPCLSYTLAQQRGAFSISGMPQGHDWASVVVEDFTPPGNAQFFGLTIQNNEFSPVYRKGALLIAAVEPPTQAHDRVLVCTVDGRLHIMELLRLTGNHAEMRPINEQAQIRIDIQDISWMSRILWASQ